MSIKKRPADFIFFSIASFSGWTILFILAAVFSFLLLYAYPALFSPLEDNNDSLRSDAGGFLQYIFPLIFGTIWVSLLAMIIAVPIGIYAALFVSHFCPRKIRGTLGFLIDLLAAVPSIIFGLWGILILAPMARDVYNALHQYLGWIPLFASKPTPTGKNMLTAAIVLAIMILPIIISLTRETLIQTPKAYEEASLALGATKWEMIKQAVLPYSASGVFASCVLALGRALGETMAITMVLSSAGTVTFDLLGSSNPTTIASSIAKNFPEASGLDSSSLIAGGLVLFIITLATNILGRLIIRRSKVRRA